jgi:hemolysin D
LIDTNLRLPQDRIELIPGMAVTAEIESRAAQGALSFLYPLLRGLDESIREY